MRWTDKQIDSMDRTQLISAFQMADQVMAASENYEQRLQQLEQKLAAIPQEVSQMRGGKSGSMAVALLVLGMILGGWIAHSFLGGLVFGGILAAAYYYYDKSVNLPKRNAQADAYEKENYSRLQVMKQGVEGEIAEFQQSDAVYNVQLLVPQNYFNHEAIAALINLLQTRRASSVSEAFNAYETQKHQQRIEGYHYQNLILNQAQLQTQQRTAAASESTAKNTKNIASNTWDIANNTRKVAARMKDVVSNTGGILNNTNKIAADTEKIGSGGSDMMKMGKGMVECHYCKAPMSAKATVCPHCGRGLPSFREELADMIGG